MYLSIIIPCYNEENRIAKTLKEISSHLKRKDFDYEIVVVNDGSSDKTSEVVNNLKIEEIVFIDNKENRGKGFVVRQGLMSSRGEYRIFTDADNSTPIEEIDKFIPYLEDYDIIIGSRAMKESVIKNPQPFSRIFVGKVFNLMVQFITGLWGVWDTQCGFKSFNKKAVNEIIPLCVIDRWAFDPEIIKLAKIKGLKIKEVPIVWINDKESKVKKRAMIKMAIDLLLIRWNLIKRTYGRK